MTNVEFLAAMIAYTKWLVLEAALIGLVILLFFGLVEVIRIRFKLRMDSSDNKLTGERSDMKVLTDHATGIQYLVTREGHITPRILSLDEHGMPIFVTKGWDSSQPKFVHKDYSGAPPTTEYVRRD